MAGRSILVLSAGKNWGPVTNTMKLLCEKVDLFKFLMAIVHLTPHSEVTWLILRGHR